MLLKVKTLLPFQHPCGGLLCFKHLRLLPFRTALCGYICFKILRLHLFATPLRRFHLLQQSLVVAFSTPFRWCSLLQTSSVVAFSNTPMRRFNLLSNIFGCCFFNTLAAVLFASKICDCCQHPIAVLFASKICDCCQHPMRRFYLLQTSSVVAFSTPYSVFICFKNL